MEHAQLSPPAASQARPPRRRRLTLRSLFIATFAGTMALIVSPYVLGFYSSRKYASLVASAGACSRAVYSFWTGCDCGSTTDQTTCLIKYVPCGFWNYQTGLDPVS